MDRHSAAYDVHASTLIQIPQIPGFASFLSRREGANANASRFEERYLDLIRGGV